MARFSAYQLAAPQANLKDLLERTDASRSLTSRATSRQMGSMKEELAKELEEAQKRARAKAKRKRGFANLVKGVGSLFGPAGAAIGGALAGGITASQQKKGLKELLNVGKAGRFSKTFLKDDLKSYMDEAKEMQMSSKDIVSGSIAGGLEGYVMGKALGGDGFEGLGEKMLSKGDAYVPAASGSSVGIQAPKDLFGTKGIGLSGQGQLAFNPGTSKMISGGGQAFPPFKPFSHGASIKAPDLLGGGNISKLTSSMGIKPDLISRPVGSMVAGAGKRTPFKNLWGSLKGFGKEGIGDASKDIMAISLLQHLLGGGEY